MSYQVINPFIQFVDTASGQPLGAGQLYFGRQDSDPKNQPANRINVYAVQDNGSEVLLSQPITLNAAGQPQYNGSVKQLRVEMYGSELSYAVQVFNKSGAQKGYSPRVTAMVDLAGLGAVDSTVLIAGVQARAFRTINGIKNLLPIENALLKVTNFYVNGTFGGNDFVYLSLVNKSNHGKITGDTLYIAPEAITAWDGTTANIDTLWGWSGSGSGCYAVQKNMFTVIDFGADPTGINEAYKHIGWNAKAFEGNGGYGCINFPSGLYKVSNTIPNLKNTINVQGAGSSNTFIKAYTTGTTPVFQSGGLAAGTNAFTKYSGFALVSQLYDGYGLQFKDSAFLQLEDIYTEGFNQHWRLDSVLTTTLLKCISRFGPASSLGLYAHNIGSSNPNALTFVGCSFGALGGGAMVIDNPSRLSYVGGSIESCGSGSGGAVVINDAGGQGPAAFSFETYFEGNKGVSDVWVKMSAASAPFTGVFRNCSFNRLDVAFAENNIRLTQAAGSQLAVIKVGDGCAFRGFAPYVGNILRKNIFFDSASGNYRLVDDNSNAYLIPEEVPQVPLPELTYGSSIPVDCSKYAEDQFMPLTILDGNSFTIQNPTNTRVGQKVKFYIRNTYGTPAGAVTFGSFYRLASSVTAPILNYAMTIEFLLAPNGLYIETGRVTGVVAV